MRVYAPREGAGRRDGVGATVRESTRRVRSHGSFATASFRAGYHGDLNETFVVGQCSQQDIGLVETAFRCLEAGAALIRPGTMYRDIGSNIERVAKKRGC